MKNSRSQHLAHDHMAMGVLGVVFAALILSGAYYIGGYTFGDHIDAREFGGRILSFEGDTIELVGMYIFDNPAQTQDVHQGVEAHVKANISNQTTWTKIRIYLPTQEEADRLKAGKGYYGPEDLRQEEVVGSIEDVRARKPDIRVRGDKNIFGKESFTAREVIYYEFVPAL